jgi:hypothetical protein
MARLPLRGGQVGFERDFAAFRVVGALSSLATPARPVAIASVIEAAAREPS